MLIKHLSTQSSEDEKKLQTTLIRLRYLSILVTLLIACFLFSAISNSTVFLFFETKLSDLSLNTYLYTLTTNSSEERFTIRTMGCTIPSLEPFDDAVKKLVPYPKDMKQCRYSNISILENNRTHIWINRQNIKYLNTTRACFKCCYKSFYRPDTILSVTSSKLDDRVNYNDCLYFTDTIKVKHEFVRVICNSNGTEVYEKFFPFAPKKKLIRRDGTPDVLPDETPYNVIVMGIDAVSRLNFHRTMPKTVKFLQRNGAVELLGYNKVGDNTFPNLIPMLLGIKVTELKRTCLPHDRATFDNCPFVWEWFKQAGYYTALAEDSAKLGTFNYVKVGFIGTPTDYYLHTFIHEAVEHTGNNHDFNSDLCINEKFCYQVLLDYVRDLTSTLYPSKLFGFFWETTMSHDYLNYPMVMDDSYEEFFNRLKETKYLDRTIFFLVSDHGIRWGKIRTTKRGRLEERLPFVYVLVPKSFRKVYNLAVNHLNLNRYRLTTPFDLHATLIDLVNFNNINNTIMQNRIKETYGNNRGISLFLPIPENRSCVQADIDDHWCTCQKGKKILTEDKEAQDAAAFLVMHLNNQLRYQPQCAQLNLAELKDVTEMIIGEAAEVHEDGWREFMVIIRTSPGDAIFEATLRLQNEKWSIAGTASRLNLYGDQSRCVHNYQLKLYCYCI